MTTSEAIEADILARWIDGNRETLPSEESLVAVWVMRPDLAPSPRVSLDDVLSRVNTGPLSENVSVSDGEAVQVSEDDFVEAIFAQSRSSTDLSVSLEDVLSRVVSGPLSTTVIESVEGVQETESIPQSANNNRWWSAPWVAGGLAAALVLFTLLPSQFEAPVSDDSIFAPALEAEEALPAEDVEARVQPSTSKKFAPRKEMAPQQVLQTVEEQKPLMDVSSKSEVIEPKKSKRAVEPQAPKAKRAEDIAPLSEEKAIVTGATFGVNRPSVPKTVQEKAERAEFDIGVTNSSAGVILKSDSAYNDLGGNMDQSETNEYIGSTGNNATVGGSDEFEELSIAQGAVSLSKAQDDNDLMEAEALDEEHAEPEADVMPVSLEDTVVDAGVIKEVEELEDMVVSRTALDAVTTESIVKESTKLPRRKKDRPSAGLFAKQQAPSVAEAPMDEAAPVEIVETEAQLPSVLTLEQRQAVKQAQSVAAVLALCSTSKPTESLEILWLASRFASPTDAIVLLRESSTYDNGDGRYLKRNWLLLARLLRQTNQAAEATKYEQRALSLP